MNSISISILCGGKARRFGRDKALYRVNGKPMIIQIFERLRHFSDDLFMQGSVNGYSGEVRSHPDVVGDRGALGGIYSSLVNARHEKVFVVACDMPFVDGRILDELLEYAEYDVVVPRWRSGHYEPLCALYSRNLIPTIEMQMKEDVHKISRLYSNVALKTLDIDLLIGTGRLATDCFRNINRPEDLG